MRSSPYLWSLCLGAVVAAPAFAQAQSDRQQMTPQGQQPFAQQGRSGTGQAGPGQTGFGQAQMGQMQGLSEDRIRTFFQNVAQGLEQAVRSRNYGQVSQFIRNNISDDAVITTSNELYLGNRLVAQTFAEVPEEGLEDVLGSASPAIHGRRMVQDYNMDIRVRDIRPSPNQQSARVTTLITESGRIVPGERIAQAIAQLRGRLGQMAGAQQQQGQQGQQGDGQGRISALQNRIAALQEQLSAMQGQSSGQGQQSGASGQQAAQQGDGSQSRWRQLGIGGPEGLDFQAQATCVFDVTNDDGTIKITGAFCRGATRLS